MVLSVDGEEDFEAGMRIVEYMLAKVEHLRAERVSTWKKKHAMHA